MRIFVYEWTCCVEDAPLSLRREGWAMLQAVLDDFSSSREVDTVTLVHQRFDHTLPGQVHSIHGGAEEKERFRALAAGADATLVIVPETAGLLADRVRWVEEVGGRHLGPTAAAVWLAGDKRRCGQWWYEHGVPTPMVRELHAPAVYPSVLKPCDGAGSQATFLVRDAVAAAKCLEQARSDGWSRDFILQDYMPGQAVSVAFLHGPSVCIPLSPSSQLLSSDGCFRYLGGVVPLPAPLAERAVALGRRAIEGIPGLRGYVGVDLVLGDAADGGSDFAIEINPRLTTSYLGLRKLADGNLALTMLHVALGQKHGTLRWRDDVIRFHPDGTLETSSAGP